MARYWKLAPGKFPYITARGKRGIAETLAAAKKLAGGSNKSTPAKKNPKTRGKRKTAKTKTKRKRGNRILGTMGLKGILLNTVVMTVAKWATKVFAPGLDPYADSVALIGTGISGHITGTGKSLLPAGVINLSSDLLANFLTGRGIGIGASSNNGGYDF